MISKTEVDELETLIGFQRFQLGGVEVGGDHIGALGDEGFRDRRADALAGRGDESEFAFKTSAHFYTRQCQ